MPFQFPVNCKLFLTFCLTIPISSSVQGPPGCPGSSGTDPHGQIRLQVLLASSKRIVLYMTQLIIQLTEVGTLLHFYQVTLLSNDTRWPQTKMYRILCLFTWCHLLYFE